LLFYKKYCTHGLTGSLLGGYSNEKFAKEAWTIFKKKESLDDSSIGIVARVKLNCLPNTTKESNS
jgi:hypothetical protein